jgi:hypothetical protein
MSASSDHSLNANSSGGSWPVGRPLQGINGDETIDTIWNAVILGKSKFNSEKTCYDLADEYRRSGKTTKKCIENFIDWQTTKAGVASFMLRVPEFMLLDAEIPNDLFVCKYLQLRAAAVIALLCGWDVKSDQVKAIALHSMVEGSSTGAAAQEAGKAGAKIAGVWLKKLPGPVITAINRQMGFRFITKFGVEGLINLVEFLPLCGGLASGGVNAVLTNQAGWLAYGALKDGPGDVFVDEKLDKARRKGPGSSAHKSARTRA